MKIMLKFVCFILILLIEKARLESLPLSTFEMIMKFILIFLNLNYSKKALFYDEESKSNNNDIQRLIEKAVQNEMTNVKIENENINVSCIKLSYRLFFNFINFS
jgi:hypothetical protein